MIPVIEITTSSIKAKYDVSEAVAHEVIRLVLKRLEEEMGEKNE